HLECVNKVCYGCVDTPAVIAVRRGIQPPALAHYLDEIFDEYILLCVVGQEDLRQVLCDGVTCSGGGFMQAIPVEVDYRLGGIPRGLPAFPPVIVRISQQFRL